MIHLSILISLKLKGICGRIYEKGSTTHISNLPTLETHNFGYTIAIALKFA